MIGPEPAWRRRAINIEALRSEARRALPRAVFDFVDGGAEDEVTLRRNVSAFDDYQLLPRPIGGAARCDISVDLFGQRLSLPVMIAPTGHAGLIWPDGERASARAAAAAGTAYCLSHASVSTLEEIAATGAAPRWMQTYIYKERELTSEIADRAAAARNSKPKKQIFLFRRRMTSRQLSPFSFQKMLGCKC